MLALRPRLAAFIDIHSFGQQRGHAWSYKPEPPPDAEPLQQLTDSCSDVYPGSGAWSEPETAAMRNLGLALGGRIETFLDLHSYGQLILWP